MTWIPSYQASPCCARLADRHYSRGKRGSRQFCAPGCKIALHIPGEQYPFQCDALWVWWHPAITSPVGRYDSYDGWWNCALFRNERPNLYRSSDLINEAIEIANNVWGLPPYGWDTYVAPSKLRGTNPGYCYQVVGWQRDGWSKDGKKRRLFLPLGV